MRISLQTLGDNPKDHDDSYIPLEPSACDVAGLRADTTEEEWTSMDKPSSSTTPITQWKIYPPPPPPHWHPTIPYLEKPSTNPDTSRKYVGGAEEFDFAQCEIPGADSWQYAADDRGVFQVYASDEGMLTKPYLTFFFLHSFVRRIRTSF